MDKPPTDKARAAALLRRIRDLSSQAMLRDREAARRRLRQLQEKAERAHDTRPVLSELDALLRLLEESGRELQARRAHRPAVRYPHELPITARHPDIVRAIKSHPVVIISGETGCGKSTQIPKMCLEAGRGIAGKIACTQPRRIAAVTIAHRIAQELGEPLGRSVGYKIRFQDKTSRESYIKVMTDGMLLAETQNDPQLMEYDTFLIDEAHERSLNIDFLLGIARTLLVRRPELKLIITSATLDTEKFSEAFGRAPVIHVGGRLYPVEVEYLPPESMPGGKQDLDYLDSAVYAVDRLKHKAAPGDMLVFMPTEQDILETVSRLEGKHYRGTTILPLYARLPASEQGKVYSVTGPKIVVATNVAETSLTIPGIKYVVDTGLARIAQYQPGTRISSLPISPISRSSADQRLGRCGRVQAGLCVRLYSREDYEDRPQFTPPEILRSNLAEVILRMIDLGLGHPAEFPFVDGPHPRNIKDGYESLVELGAIKGQGREYELTALGRKMAAMPLDPRISRMLLEAQKEACLREVTVIASALSIRDPRERPPDKAGLADSAQAVFKHPDSDFITLLNIWDQYHHLHDNAVSKSRHRKFCQEHFLSYTRMREWGFVHDQIVSILADLSIAMGRRIRADMSPALYAAIHKSILSGFLSNIAVHKEKSAYLAAKGREVMIFPGSTLFGKTAAWITAAEVVRTARLYARTAAKIDPAWLEALGGDLCRRSYSEPRWDKDSGEVRALERVTLHGLEIVSDRDIPYGPVNPDEAHVIFVRSALVAGRVKQPPAFLRHNLALQKKVADMEEKLRRRDILESAEVQAEFYARRLPGVYDLRGLEEMIRAAGNDEFLRMKEDDLLRSAPDEESLALFPDRLTVGDRRFEATYKFAPGAGEDGVTLKVPSDLIRSVPAEPLEWGVPGQFKEKITALIKGLPKKYRKLLVPVPEKVDVILREMDAAGPSLYKSLAGFIKRKYHVDIPESEWARAEIPDHLKVRVAVTGHHWEVLAAGRDLEAVRRATKSMKPAEDSESLQKARHKLEREGLTSWDFDTLPEEIPLGPYQIAYPGLEAGAGGANIRLFKTRAEAAASHERGVEALLLLKFAKDLKFMKRYLVLPDGMDRTALSFGGKAAVEEAMFESLSREVFRKNLRTKAEFEAYAGTVIRALFEKGEALRQATIAVLEGAQKLRQTLPASPVVRRPGRAALPSVWQDIRDELDDLVPKDFLESYSLEKLSQIPRFLDALGLRVERAKNSPDKDRSKAEQVKPFVAALAKLEKLASKIGSPEMKAGIEELRGMIEEFKVSLFAPEIKTAFPVSAKRLAAKIKDIESLD
jgi:ATP-dependent helicase HrpA